MKKILLVIILTNLISYAQEDAWVYFADKENVETSIANPISILTQRAIDRKALHNIAIDERDVPVNENYISQIKAISGITVLAKSKWFNAVHVRGSVQAIEALDNLTFVTNIEFANNNLNSRGISASGEALSDSNLSNQQRVTFNYGQAANQIEMIAVNTLHQQDYTGEGMLIAVFDAGFPDVNTMSAFQRLRDNGDLLGGYDFVDRTDAIYNPQIADHGTKVLSDMAAYVQDQFVGTAPDASYILFRTEDEFNENPVEESYWVEAAERADSLGVNIINSSLGYREFDNTNYNYTEADMNGTTTFVSRGANIGFEKGLLIVCAAGNDGTEGLGAPSDAAGVFTVAAVNSEGVYSSFSSTGSSSQPTQKPDVAAKGEAVYIVDLDGQVTNQDFLFGPVNGTSFSSPIIAGAIASFWQAIPDRTNAEIMQLVRESASQFENPDFQIGYGIPNFGNALNQALSLDTFQTEDFKIYPNPVSDYLQIKLPLLTENANVKLYNILGKVVMQTTINFETTTLNFQNIAKGVYLLRLQTNNKTNTFKLIKK